ncbi:hypothetical protein [Maridesulfovibrio sp.]|uniref:hypothetical protein n=1 Tax=Maridesulfovibrio sp. TaxID=2795000 RepID=UPI003BACDC2B
MYASIKNIINKSDEELEELSRLRISGHNVRLESGLDEVLKGCESAGSEIELVSVTGLELNPCIGCFSCQEGRKCPVNDDIKSAYELGIKAVRVTETLKGSFEHFAMHNHFAYGTHTK